MKYKVNDKPRWPAQSGQQSKINKRRIDHLVKTGKASLLTRYYNGVDAVCKAAGLIS